MQFFLIFISLPLWTHALGDTTGKPMESKCSKIPQMKSFDLRHFYGEWHVPFMGNHWVKYTSKRMSGRFKKKASTTTSCVKMDVKPGLKDNMFRNSANNTIQLRTKFLKTKTETNLMCTSDAEGGNTKWSCKKPNSQGTNEAGEAELYIVDSDNKSWTLIVSCFPRNGISWAIFSKVKHLENKLVKFLLKKLEKLGLQLWNVVEVPYEKCLHKM